MTGILEEYKKMQIRFKLPEYTLLQNMFKLPQDFSDIEQVRNEISNKLFDMADKVIDPLIWCNGSCHMIEKSMLTEEESKELFYMYKKIQSLKWRNQLLMIKSDKDETVKLIRDICILWQEVEPKLSSICKKFSDGWDNLKFKSEVVEYNG